MPTSAPAPAPIPAGHAPPGTRLYAIGDIHGRLDLLDRLLDRVAEDAQTSKAPRRVLVFLGDLIDRGPQSKGVIERVMAGPPPVPRWANFIWLALLGNHDAMMLQYLDDPSVAAVWFLEGNGGLATLGAYLGAAAVRGLDGFGLRREFIAAVPDSHRGFLQGMPLSHREGGYLFVHAGVRPGVALDRQEREDLLWIRGEFLNSSADFGAIVVHGHTISRRPETRGNRIGIDTGAFMSERLTALVAEGDWRGFLNT